MIPLDRVREMLAAATPGPWGHYYNEDAGRPCVSCATPTGELCTYLIAEVCSDMVEDAALIAAAPDLARDLLSLADALATAERERDAAQHTADTLGARVTAMEAERVRFEASVYAELRATETERDAARAEAAGLRAAVARTTPPTEADAAAHNAALGWWLISRAGVCPPAAVDAFRGDGDVTAHLPFTVGATWLPLDASGRPCAWPTPALDAAGEGQ